MFKTDFSELRALRAPVFETELGGGTAKATADLMKMMGFIDKYGKRRKDALVKMEGEKVAHKFDIQEDLPWMKAMKALRDRYEHIMKMGSSRASLDVGMLHSDILSMDEILLNANKYIMNMNGGDNKKTLVNARIEEHDQLVQAIFDLKIKDPTIARSREIREMEIKLAKVKAEAITALNFIIEVYKLARKFFNGNSFVKPQLPDAHRILSPKHSELIQSLYVDAEVVKKRFKMTGVFGVLVKLPGSSDKEKYVEHINYVTQGEMVMNAGGEMWLVELMNFQDRIMAKIESQSRGPEGRWIFEQILTKDDLRTLDTKVALSKIHGYFHSYAWTVTMVYYLSYGPSPYKTKLMHGFDFINVIANKVVDDYIKSSIQGSKSEISPYELAMDILYTTPSNSKGNAIHQHLLPNINDVALYLKTSVQGYANLSSEDALRKFYTENAQRIVDLAGGNPGAMSKLPFDVQTAPGGALYVQFNTPHTVEEFTKTITEDYTLPWATIENHMRIGSALDEYICTQIINPAKNP